MGELFTDLDVNVEDHETYGANLNVSEPDVIATFLHVPEDINEYLQYLLRLFSSECMQ